MNSSIIAGVDIGGSHITAALVNISRRALEPGTMLRKEIDSSSPAEQIIQDWAEVIEACWKLQSAGKRRIGIAMPGPVDYDTGICYIRGQNKYENLYNKNLKQLLSSKLDLSVDSILMINDAAGFLAGEMFSGAGIGFQRTLGLTLGTGLGSAFYLEGNVEDADLWHHPFKEGKAEDYLSAHWLLEETRRRTRTQFINVKGLAEAADEDAILRTVFSDFGTHLGNFLSPYLRSKNIQLLIPGGNIALADRHFNTALNVSLSKNGLDNIAIRRAELGESAAMVGAASLWEQQLGIEK